MKLKRHFGLPGIQRCWILHCWSGADAFLLHENTVYRNRDPATDKKHHVKGQQQFTITTQTKAQEPSLLVRVCVCVCVCERESVYKCKADSTPFYIKEQEHSNKQYQIQQNIALLSK